jgi:hypothetical protein
LDVETGKRCLAVEVIGPGQFWQADRLNLGMAALRLEGIFVVDGKIRKS